MWDDEFVNKASQLLIEFCEERGIDPADLVVLDYQEGRVSSASITVEKIFVYKKMEDE